MKGRQFAALAASSSDQLHRRPARRAWDGYAAFSAVLGSPTQHHVGGRRKGAGCVTYWAGGVGLTTRMQRTWLGRLHRQQSTMARVPRRASRPDRRTRVARQLDDALPPIAEHVGGCHEDSKADGERSPGLGNEVEEHRAPQKRKTCGQQPRPQAGFCLVQSSRGYEGSSAATLSLEKTPTSRSGATHS